MGSSVNCRRAIRLLAGAGVQAGNRAPTSPALSEIQAPDASSDHGRVRLSELLLFAASIRTTFHAHVAIAGLRRSIYLSIDRRRSSEGQVCRGRHNTGALDDESLFAGLTEFLRQRAVSPDDKPFFIATYNIGTHAFIDINPEGDVAYGDGSKTFLDKFATTMRRSAPF